MAAEERADPQPIDAADDARRRRPGRPRSLPPRLDLALVEIALISDGIESVMSTSGGPAAQPPSADDENEQSEAHQPQIATPRAQ